MRIHVDISGQIAQLNYDSSLGMRREDGVAYAVLLKSKTKKELIRRYKGQIFNPIEKLHCILIYYCIKDHLERVDELVICPDVNFRRLKYLLPFLFREYPRFKDVRIRQRMKDEPKSNGHITAIKAHRKKKYANIIINKEMVAKKILEFKDYAVGAVYQR